MKNQCSNGNQIFYFEVRIQHIIWEWKQNRKEERVTTKTKRDVWQCYIPSWTHDGLWMFLFPIIIIIIIIIMINNIKNINNKK